MKRTLSIMLAVLCAVWLSSGTVFACGQGNGAAGAGQGANAAGRQAPGGANKPGVGGLANAPQVPAKMGAKQGGQKVVVGEAAISGGALKGA